MSAGDRELRKAFEETTNRNIKAFLENNKETRKKVRELAEEIQTLRNMVKSQTELLEQQRQQLSTLQQRFYAKGTVNYSD